MPQRRFRGIGKEVFLKFLLLPQPFLTPRYRLLKLDHLIGDDLALLQRFLLGDQLVQRQSSTMQCLFNFPAGFNGPLHMLADGLGDFVLILLCDFDEGVQLAQVDA